MERFSSIKSVLFLTALLCLAQLVLTSQPLYKLVAKSKISSKCREVLENEMPNLLEFHAIEINWKSLQSNTFCIPNVNNDQRCFVFTKVLQSKTQEVTTYSGYFEEFKIQASSQSTNINSTTITTSFHFQRLPIARKKLLTAAFNLGNPSFRYRILGSCDLRNHVIVIESLPILTGECSCNCTDIFNVPDAELKVYNKREVATTTTAEIDVLIFYSARILAKEIGTTNEIKLASLKNKIAAKVAELNVVLKNSLAVEKVKHSFAVKVIAIFKIPFEVSGTLKEAFTTFSTHSTIHRLAKTLGADLISLFDVAPGEKRGYAQDNSVYSVSTLNQFAFAHQIGHNLGLGHENGAADRFNVAYKFKHTGTVMTAEPSSDALAYFSNPDIKLVLPQYFEDLRIGEVKKDNTRALKISFPKVAARIARVAFPTNCATDSDNDGYPNCVDECPQSDKLVLKTVCDNCADFTKLPACSKCASQVPNAYKPTTTLYVSIGKDSFDFKLATGAKLNKRSNTRMTLRNPLSSKKFYLEDNSNAVAIKHEQTSKFRLTNKETNQIRFDVDFSNLNMYLTTAPTGKAFQVIQYKKEAQHGTSKKQTSITLDIKAGKEFVVIYKLVGQILHILKLENGKQTTLHSFRAGFPYCEQIFLDYVSHDIYYCEVTTDNKVMGLKKVNARTGTKLAVINNLPIIAGFSIDVYSKLAFVASVSGSELLQCPFSATSKSGCKRLFQQAFRTGVTISSDFSKAYCDSAAYSVSIEAVDANKQEGSLHSFKLSRTGNIHTGSYITYRVIPKYTAYNNNFKSLKGEVYLAPGDSSVALNVESKGYFGHLSSNDDIKEFTVKLVSVGANGKISLSAAVGTVQLNSYVLNMVGSTLTVLEGNSPNGKGIHIIKVGVGRTGNIEEKAYFRYTARSTSSTTSFSKQEDDAAPYDFAPGAFPVALSVGSIPAKQKFVDLTFPLIADLDVERNVKFTVELAIESLSGISTTVTIQNDDALFTIFTKDKQLVEGDNANSGSKFAYEVSKVGNVNKETTVAWSIVHYGSSNNDFKPPTSGTLTFVASDKAKKTIEIQVVGDTIAESNEEFGILLSNPSAGKIGSPSQAKSIIQNDDAPFQIKGPGSIKEGSNAITKFAFVIERPLAGPKRISFTYSVVGSGQNKATKDDFFERKLPSGKVTLESKATKAIVYIPVLGDNKVEPSESFVVKFESSFSPILISSTVIDDDTAIGVSAVDAEKFEGNAGTTTAFTFKIARIGYLSNSHQVTAQVVPLEEGLTSADFAGDTFPKHLLTFKAGEANKVITVNVKGDKKLERDETFAVIISMKSIPISVTLSNVQAVGRIKNDDISLQAYISESGFAMGEKAKFIVERTGFLGAAAQVSYRIFLQTATSQNFGTDVTSVQQRTMQKGQNKLNIEYDISTTANGGSYRFVATCSSIANCEAPNAVVFSSIAAAGATEIRIASAGAVQKKEGTGSNVAFKFRLFYSVILIGGTATVRVGGIDIQGRHKATSADITGGFGARTISLPANTNSVLFEIVAAGDSLFEEDEYFSVTVENGGALTVANPKVAVATILNDDFALERWHIALKESIDIFEVEREVRFYILKHRSVGKASSVTWTVEGKGPSAVSPLDFIPPTALPLSTISFAAGSASAKLASFKVASDTKIEADEEFFLKLQNPTSGTLSTNSKVAGRIISSNVVVEFKDNTNIQMLEGSGKATTISIDIVRKGYNKDPATVAYEVVAGSKANAADFAVNSLPMGTVSFKSGETSNVITFQLNGDTQLESDESFTIKLTNPQLAQIGTVSTKKITIKNDDTLIELVASTQTVVEKVKRTVEVLSTVEFKLKRSGFLGIAQKVQYTITPAPGKKPIEMADANDFKDKSKFNSIQEVSFTANQAEKAITISVVGDNVVEEKEHFTVQLVKAVPQTQLSASALQFAITDSDISATFSTIQRMPESSATFKYTVTRKGSNLKQCKTKIKVKFGEVVVNSDFNSAQINSPPVLQFNAGQASAQFTFSAKDDSVVEADEQFSFILDDENLADACGFTSQSPNTVLAVILNDDIEMSVAVVGDATMFEGSTKGSRFAKFQFTRKGLLSKPVALTYTITGSINNADVQGTIPAGNQVINFGANEATKNIQFSIIEDSEAEQNENIVVTLISSTNGAQISSTSKIATILVKNDDAMYTATPTSLIKLEGAPNQDNTFAYTITRSNFNIATPVTFNIALVTSTEQGATKADFKSIPTQVTITANQLSASFSLVIKGDLTVENNEQFEISLALVNSEVKLVVKGEIKNDDAAFKIQTAQAKKLEGSNGLTPFNFAIVRTGETAATATVKYTLTSFPGKESANAQDFKAGQFGQATLVTFAAGEAQKQLLVNIIGDSTEESDEYFKIVLSDATITVVEPEIQGIITSDDGAKVDFVDVTVFKAEGDSGITEFPFVIKRTGNSNAAVTVTWVLTSSDCTPTDFVGIAQLPFTGTTTVEANKNEATATVKVRGDTTVEDSEIFYLYVTSAVGASAGSTTAFGGIVADDWAVTVATGNKKRALDQITEVAEGSFGGVSKFKFKLQRSGDVSSSILFSYFVSVSPGANFAQSSDFEGNVLPRAYDVTFPANNAEVEIAIGVLADKEAEADEKFTVTVLLTSKDRTPIANSFDFVIKNDDVSYQLLPVTSSIAEGNGLTNNKLKFKVIKSGVLDTATTVPYIISSLSTTTDDLVTTFGNKNVLFAIGETEAVIEIIVKGDNKPEADESVSVMLDGNNLSNGELLVPNSATGVIINDDTAVSIVAQMGELLEGSSITNGLTSVKFIVERLGLLTMQSSVHYKVVPKQTNANDFGDSIATSVQVNFGVGESAKEVVIRVKQDSNVEADEKFDVILSNAVNCVIDVASVSVTILNDDSTIVIAPVKSTSLEGNAGDNSLGSLVEFTVKRQGYLASKVSVKYTVSGDVNAQDFMPNQRFTGTIVIRPENDESVLSLRIKQDNVVEANEEVIITISDFSPSTTSGGATVAKTVIINDDASIKVKEDKVVAEGDAGNTKVTFVVEREGSTDRTDSFTYAILQTPSNQLAAGQQAATANDFAGNILPTGTATIPIGATSINIEVKIRGDTTVEKQETFIFKIIRSRAAIITIHSKKGTITNDDTDYRITGKTSTPSAIAEGNSGSTPFWFTIARTGVLNAAQISYKIVPIGNSVTQLDFVTTMNPVSLQFANNQEQADISILVKGDTNVEGAERFKVLITAIPTGSETTKQSQAATILADDASVEISTSAPFVFEGDTGVTVVKFVVHRKGAADKPCSAKYVIRGTDVNAADFKAGEFDVSRTVTLNVGEVDKEVLVTINGDNAEEGDEEFTVTLSNPLNCVITTAVATSTIVNDDSATQAIVSLFPAVIEKLEGDAVDSEFSYFVVRKGNVAQPLIVDYTVTSAGGAAQFTSPMSGTLKWNAGNGGSQPIIVTAKADEIVEANTAFKISITTSATTFNKISDGVILNDDVLFNIQADIASIDEGSNNNNNKLSFTVTRSAEYTLPSTISYHVVGDVDAADFVGVGPANPVQSDITINFGKDELSVQIFVVIAADTVPERDEQFFVEITRPSVGQINTKQAKAVILNDDERISITIPESNAGVAEGNNNIKQSFDFLITREGFISGDSSFVVVEIVDVTTDAFDFDFSTTGQLVEFKPSETNKVISVVVLGDNIEEANEEFKVVASLYELSGTLQRVEISRTIVNDDSTFSLKSASPLALPESQPNSMAGSSFIFEVHRSGALSTETTIQLQIGPSFFDSSFQFIESCAASDVATGFVTSVLLFSKGEDKKELTVSAVSDSIPEQDEAFKVTISKPQVANSLIDEDQATLVRIFSNDDTAISFKEVRNIISVVEGAKGEEQQVRIAIVKAGVAAVSVAYNIKLTGNANSNDFTPSTSFQGSLTFSSNVLEQQISFTIKGDNDFEPNEVFEIELSSVSGAAIVGKTKLQVTIANDDIKYTFKASKLAVEEGNHDDHVLPVVVERSSSQRSETVGVALQLLGFQHAASLNDFAKAPVTSIFFAKNELQKKILLIIKADDLLEPDESFSLQINSNNLKNVDVKSATVTIVLENDDLEISIVKKDAIKPEGNAGEVTEFVFEVHRAGISALPVSVDYIVGGTAAIDDFKTNDNIYPRGILRFAAQQSSALIKLLIAGDTTQEGDESFTVTLSNPSTGSISASKNSETGIIQGDDGPNASYGIKAILESTLEGSSGNTAVKFKVTRFGNLQKEGSIKYSIAGDIDATDIADRNSLPTNVRLSFEVGSAVKIIEVLVRGDTTVEPNEKLQVTITEVQAPDIMPTNGITTVATTIIVTDDALLEISGPASIIEGTSASSSTIALYTISRSESYAIESKVDLMFNTVTASAQDFSVVPTASQTITFPPNDATVKLVSILIKQDDLVENDEQFSVVLSSPHGGLIKQNKGSITTTIINDDFPKAKVVITALQTSLQEGTSTNVQSTTKFSFSIAATQVSANINVFYKALFKGSAQDADSSDFIGSTSGTVTLTKATPTSTLVLNVVQDSNKEANEQFEIALSGDSSKIVFDTAIAVSTITNDDKCPTGQGSFPCRSCSRSNEILDANTDECVLCSSTQQPNSGKTECVNKPDCALPTTITATFANNVVTTLTSSASDKNYFPIITNSAFSLAANTISGTTALPTFPIAIEAKSTSFNTETTISGADCNPSTITFGVAINKPIVLININQLGTFDINLNGVQLLTISNIQSKKRSILLSDEVVSQIVSLIISVIDISPSSMRLVSSTSTSIVLAVLNQQTEVALLQQMIVNKHPIFSGTLLANVIITVTSPESPVIHSTQSSNDSNSDNSDNSEPSSKSSPPSQPSPSTSSVTTSSKKSRTKHSNSPQPSSSRHSSSKASTLMVNTYICLLLFVCSWILLF